jgi:hypothetical protein
MGEEKKKPISIKQTATVSRRAQQQKNQKKKNPNNHWYGKLTKINKRLVNNDLNGQRDSGVRPETTKRLSVLVPQVRQWQF